ncbi:MAG: DUF4864 domain-containing protein [Chlamydiales bacterium]|nr:DUF4864 domain-containing protein [Chlamydiia bacterium]MCP5507402.1 DUF4864 domain-containing protein [Chlamydiales bacterium]
MCSAPIKESSPKKGFPIWLLVLITLLLLGGVGVYYAMTGVGVLVKPVEEQLKALENDQVTKAYFNYTSKEFQEATSLTEFKEFLKRHPSLTEYQSYSFRSRSIENNIGQLKGYLISKSGGTTPIEYLLVKEDDEWKIQRIEVGPQGLAESHDPQLRAEIQEPISEQLNALKEKDYEKAYEDYASHDFKQATPLDTFEIFIDNYPILTNFEKFDIANYSGSEDRASANVLLSNADGTVPIEYRFVKEGGKWKIWSMRLILPPDEQVDNPNEDIPALAAPINEQLELLNAGNIKKAYAIVAKGFKSATSESDFEKFVSQFPILLNNRARLIEHYLNKNNAKLKLELSNDNESADVEYTLVKEDGEWKILGIEMVGKEDETPAIEKSTEFDSSVLNKTIEKQLEAIRNHDYTKAYDEYTSKEFKKATSLDDFMSFINSYPIFSENSSSNLTNLTFNNNIGTLTGTLTSVDGDVKNVEYNMIQEDGVWKILSIKILSQEQKVEEKQNLSAVKDPIHFDAIDLGNAINAEGTITYPKTTFRNDDKEIYATLHLSNAKVGDEVSVKLQHLANGASISPVSTVIDKAGKATLSFVFSAPKQGWPAGKYQLQIQSKSGAEMKQSFAVAK